MSARTATRAARSMPAFYGRRGPRLERRGPRVVCGWCGRWAVRSEGLRCRSQSYLVNAGLLDPAAIRELGADAALPWSPHGTLEPVYMPSAGESSLAAVRAARRRVQAAQRAGAAARRADEDARRRAQWAREAPERARREAAPRERERQAEAQSAQEKAAREARRATGAALYAAHTERLAGACRGVVPNGSVLRRVRRPEMGVVSGDHRVYVHAGGEGQCQTPVGASVCTCGRDTLVWESA